MQLKMEMKLKLKKFCHLNLPPPSGGMKMNLCRMYLG